MLRTTLGTLALTMVVAASLGAQSPRSVHLVQELDSLLRARSLDAIAAADPDAPDRFVAALAYSKSQLLVVDARYPAPDLLRQEIADAKFRDVYMALQQSGLPDSRLFFLDLGYDGLRDSADAVDVLYQGASSQILFDGQPDKHKLTKTAYEKQYVTAEATYSRLLDVLIGQAKGSPLP